jgi:DNA repair exonuclease SbcCD ATPase subunit
MLYFEKIRWKNFLSTGNVFTEIQFDRSPSTVVVGENGAGKSTMLDALTFVLFNKPFRNIKKGQLSNSVNKRDCLVEIEFKIGTNSYQVRRGISPAIFEIIKNGKLVDQPGASKDYQVILEDTILKLNYKSFTQVVILGSATFTPFMQLSNNDRRTVIEDLLDIQIFSGMNQLLKDRISKNKSDRLSAENKIELITDKIEVQETYLKKLQEQTDKQIKELEEEISDWDNDVSNSTIREQEIADTISNLVEAISNSDKISIKSDRVSTLLMILQEKVSSAEKRLRFYRSNDHCPTCEQIIEFENKTEHIKKNSNIVDETDAAVSLLKIEQEKLICSIDKIHIIQTKIAEYQSDLINIKFEKKLCGDNINRANQKIAHLLKESANDNGEENPHDKIEKFKKETEAHKEESKQLSDEAEVFKYANKILKDGGIKAIIIRQYIPIINKLVNKYLASLDFFVNFELDDGFNEVIKSRHRDAFSYASFSEGEKARIDISLMLTWRSVAKLKNSVNTNLLILDEVFDGSVDANGSDILMGLFDELHSTNIFVISHKGDQLADRFRSAIKFEKIKSFSRIAA